MTLQAYLAIWLGGLLMLSLPTWAWPLQLFFAVLALQTIRQHRDHARPAVIDPNDLGALRRRDEQV